MTQIKILPIAILMLFLSGCISPENIDESSDKQKISENTSIYTTIEVENNDNKDKMNNNENDNKSISENETSLTVEFPEETKQLTEKVNNTNLSTINPSTMKQMLQKMLEEGITTKSAPDRFISTNFVNLSQIQRISKYRSGYGHDFSHTTSETCRSMKHYFDLKAGVSASTVKYYAPTAGIIKDIYYSSHEYGTEARFSLIPTAHSKYRLRFFHIALAEGLQEGSTVTAGQVLGTIGHPQAHAEIAVEINSFHGGIISFFEIISEELAAEYTSRGITNKKIVLSQDERDANPLQCDYNTPDGRFVGVQKHTGSFQDWQNGEENWVTLT